MLNLILKRFFRYLILVFIMYPVFLFLFVVLKIISFVSVGPFHSSLRNNTNLKSSFFGDLFLKNELFNFSRINIWNRPLRLLRSLDDLFILSKKNYYFAQLLSSEQVNITNRFILFFSQNISLNLKSFIQYSFILHLFIKSIKLGDFLSLIFYLKDFFSFYKILYLFSKLVLFYFRTFFFYCSIVFKHVCIFSVIICRFILRIILFYILLVLKSLSTFYSKNYYHIKFSLFDIFKILIRLFLLSITLPYIIIYSFIVFVKIVFILFKLLIISKNLQSYKSLDIIYDFDFLDQLNILSKRKFKKYLINLVSSYYFSNKITNKKSFFFQLHSFFALLIILVKNFSYTLMRFFFNFLFNDNHRFRKFAFVLLFLVIFFFVFYISNIFLFPSDFRAIIILFTILYFVIFYFKLLLLELIRFYYIYIVFFWKLRRRKSSVIRKNTIIDIWDRFLKQHKYIQFLGASVHTIYNKKYELFSKALPLYTKYISIIKRKNKENENRKIPEDEQLETLRQNQNFYKIQKAVRVPLRYRIPKREILYSFLFFEDLLNNDVIKEFEIERVNYSYARFIEEVVFFSSVILNNVVSLRIGLTNTSFAVLKSLIYVKFLYYIYFLFMRLVQEFKKYCFVSFKNLFQKIFMNSLYNILYTILFIFSSLNLSFSLFYKFTFLVLALFRTIFYINLFKN